MAFILADLKCTHSAGKSRTYKYTSATDAVAAIGASGYFDGAVNELKQGDTIIGHDSVPATFTLSVSSATGATPVTTV